MGQTITSVVDMVSYAGDLRHAAKQAPTAEVAEKIHRSADHLEKTAFSHIREAGAGIGLMLDTLA